VMLQCTVALPPPSIADRNDMDSRLGDEFG
jgi:hypothetical protein